MRFSLLISFFLLLLTGISFAQNNGQLNSSTNMPGIFSSKNYVKNPDCAKNTENITASGGSLAKGTTTPLNEDSGTECTIDASASGQTYTWAFNTLGQGLKGQNCEVRFTYEGDASYYKAYIKQGSNQITDDLTLSYPTYTRTASINFPCGDLASATTFVIESTNSSAAAISVGKLYGGAATNTGIFNTNEPMVGYTPTISAGFGTASNVEFFYSRSGNMAHIQGRFQAGTVAASLGSVTLPNGASIGSVLTNTTAVGRWSSNNVTTNHIKTGPVIATGGGTILRFSSDDYVGTASGFDQLNGDAVCDSTNYVTFFADIPIEGWAAESVIMANQAPWYVDAIISGDNPDLGVSAVATAKEIGNANLTMTPTSGSAAVGIMCSGTNAATSPSTSATTCSAGNEVIGFNANFPKAGTYEICIDVNDYISVGQGVAIDAGLFISETATTCASSPCTVSDAIANSPNVSNSYLAGGSTAGSGNNIVRPIHHCWRQSISASGIHGYRLMYAQSVSGVPTNHLITADTSIGGRNIHVSVSPITSQVAQPLLVGSISSSTAGLERVERVNVGGGTACSASPCTITSQSGSWVTSVTRTTTGEYEINMASSMFSSIPACSVQSISTTAGEARMEYANSTTSLLKIKTCNSGCTAAIDQSFNVICMGPR